MVRSAHLAHATPHGQPGLGYAVGNSTTLNLSWRYFGLKWDNGQSGSERNGLLQYQNGPELSVKFFF